MEEDSRGSDQISLRGLEGISQPLRCFFVANTLCGLFALILMVTLKGVILPHFIYIYYFLFFY